LGELGRVSGWINRVVLAMRETSCGEGVVDERTPIVLPDLTGASEEVYDVSVGGESGEAARRRQRGSPEWVVVG
jgi:hypothetical protein